MEKTNPAYFIKTLQNVTKIKPVKTETSAPEMSIHSAIRPIYAVLKPTFFWPYRYAKDDKIIPLTTADNFLRYLFLAVLAIHFAWSMCKRLEKDLPQQQYLAWIVIDNIYITCAYFLTTVSILITHFVGSELTKRFFEECEELRKSLKVDGLALKRLRGKLLRQILILGAVWTSIISPDILSLIFLIEDINIFHYVGVYVSQLLLVLVFVQMNCKLEILKDHFGALNGNLLSIVDDKSPGLIATTNEIKFVSRLHGKLCGLIDNWNSVHGWQFIFLIATLTSSVLDTLHAAVSFNYIAPLAIKTALLIVQIALITFYCSLVVILAGKCSSISKNALKTGNIASETVANPKTSPPSREELRVLMEQISYRNPHFSAAGIFTLDMTTVSMILGAITSYFIVLLQFRDLSPCLCSCNCTGYNLN